MIDTAAELLQVYTGLDVTSPHGADTPARFLAMLDELTKCKDLTGTPKEDKKHMQNCIKWKTFPTRKDDMIVVQNIGFTSLCEHHLIPFMGVVHVGYVPNKTIAGLSKFARVVRHYARRLQVQETLTDDIASYLEDHLEKPKGVAVLIQAEHLCYDDQTEILTESGWVYFKHLQSGQKVCQVDVATGIGSFVVPSNYVAYHYTGPMMLGESLKTSMLVTPDHRIYYKTDWGHKAAGRHHTQRRWQVDSAARVWTLKSRLVLPRTANFTNGAEGTLDWARFLGIWSADGCTTTHNGRPLVVIAQNPGPTADEIKALLDRLQYNYYVGRTTTGCLQFKIRENWLYDQLRPLKNSVDRQGPREVLAMTTQCIEEYLVWHRKGDGDHWDSSLAAQEAHYSTSKTLIDFLQECLILTGKTGNIRSRFYGGKLRYTLRPAAVPTTSFRLQDRSVVDYDGEVYCVSVPTGAIMVRRHGTPLISGNCMTIRGVQAPGTFTTTSTMRGVFGQHERTAKAEFLQIIRGSLK